MIIDHGSWPRKSAMATERKGWSPLEKALVAKQWQTGNGRPRPHHEILNTPHAESQVSSLVSRSVPISLLMIE